MQVQELSSRVLRHFAHTLHTTAQVELSSVMNLRHPNRRHPTIMLQQRYVQNKPWAAKSTALSQIKVERQDDIMVLPNMWLTPISGHQLI